MLDVKAKWFEQIRERRLELDLSPNDVAKAANISRPALLNIEAGDTKFPRYETIKAIGDVLGLDAWELYTGTRAAADDRTSVEVELVETFDAQTLADVQINLLTIKELDPEEFELVARQLAERRAKLEREAREAREARKRARRAERDKPSSPE